MHSKYNSVEQILIEKYIISRNKEYIHQAYEITYTINPISSLIVDYSFTKFGSGILLGTADLTDKNYCQFNTDS